jgi:hypothetical protein
MPAGVAPHGSGLATDAQARGCGVMPQRRRIFLSGLQRAAAKRKYQKRYQKRYRKTHAGECRLAQRMPWPEPNPSSPLIDSLVILKRSMWLFVECYTPHHGAS